MHQLLIDYYCIIDCICTNSANLSQVPQQKCNIRGDWPHCRKDLQTLSVSMFKCQVSWYILERGVLGKIYRELHDVWDWAWIWLLIGVAILNRTYLVREDNSDDEEISQETDGQHDGAEDQGRGGDILWELSNDSVGCVNTVQCTKCHGWLQISKRYVKFNIGQISDRIIIKSV